MDRVSLPVRIGLAFAAIVLLAGLGALLMRWAARASEPQPQVVSTKPNGEFTAVLAGAQWLKSTMKKPESFELISATMVDGKVVCYQYAARNSLNDRKTEQYVIADGVSSSKADDWNRLCAGKRGTDYTHARSAL